MYESRTGREQLSVQHLLPSWHRSVCVRVPRLLATAPLDTHRGPGTGRLPPGAVPEPRASRGARLALGDAGGACACDASRLAREAFLTCTLVRGHGPPVSFSSSRGPTQTGHAAEHHSAVITGTPSPRGRLLMGPMLVPQGVGGPRAVPHADRRQLPVPLWPRQEVGDPDRLNPDRLNTQACASTCPVGLPHVEVGPRGPGGPVTRDPHCVSREALTTPWKAVSYAPPLPLHDSAPLPLPPPRPQSAAAAA